MPKSNPFSPFDELDYKIIRVLNADARASAVDIARQVNANQHTIRKRIDRLVEMHVLRLTAVVDPRAFGYGISVDIFLEIDLEHEEAIQKHLLSMPQISYLALGQSTNSISIEGQFKHTEEMHEFLHRTLPSIEGVRVSGYALVPRILRNIDEWLPAQEDFNI